MKKEKTPMKASKKLTILAITILLAAALISALWWVLVYVPYQGYVKDYTKAPMQMTTDVYEKQKNDFSYQVRFPHFLSEDTFLKVQYGKNIRGTDENGEALQKYAVEFFVWPAYCTKTEYGLVLENKQYIVDVKKEADGRFTVTHDYTDPEALEAFAAYEEEIQAVIQKADEEWEWERKKAIQEGFKVLFSKES